MRAAASSTVTSESPIIGPVSGDAGEGLVETASAFVEMDEQGRYLDASAEALAVYGVSLETLRNHRVGDFSGSGLGAVHRALFLWLARRNHDFGGGDGTVVSPDGRQTHIRCTSVRRVGDRFQMTFRTVPGAGVPPHSQNIPAVLDAWREAERDLAAASSDTDRKLAGQVSASLRDIYHYVSRRRY